MAIKEAASSGINPAADVQQATPRDKSQVRVQDPAQHNGLCLDCEDRDGCCLTAVEGGVWHCEEYR